MSDKSADVWPKRPLGELTDNFDSIRVPVKEKDRISGSYPYYGASGIVDHVDSYLFDGEYLLIAEDGENLRTRNTPVAFMATGKFWVNNHAHIVRGNREADTRFLMYVLANTDVGGYLSGSTMPKLTQGSMNRIPVVAPPLIEQQAIACILGALDDKIELNRRRNRTLQAMARAIFQSWFVDFDPVKAKAAGRKPAGLSKDIAALFPASFEDSELGEISKGWRACRWGDIATLEYGKSLRDYAQANGSVRVFGTNGPIGWHTEPLCDGPGIVIGRKGAYRGIHYSPNPFYVIDTAFYLKPKEPIDLKWVYYEWLKCDINGMDSGSAIPSTSRADFYSIPVCLPSRNVLQDYGKRTQPMYDQRHANESENNTLAALRDALLPKLSSGELRVPDAERIVGRAV